MHISDFLKLSLSFYTLALGLHFVLLVAIVMGTVSYCVIKSYKNTSNKNDYDNQASVKNFSNHSWKIIKKRILTYLLASGLGFIISKFLFIVF